MNVGMNASAAPAAAQQLYAAWAAAAAAAFTSGHSGHQSVPQASPFWSPLNAQTAGLLAERAAQFRDREDIEHKSRGKCY